MNVAVVGSTGFIGQRLVEVLKKKGHSVTGVSLRKSGWESAVSEADAVVNLAGEPIFGKRWDTYVKGEIFDSRINGTQKIVDILGEAKKNDPEKKRCFVCASAIGYYGPHEDEELNEQSEAGHDFLAFVCREWEDVAEKAHLHHDIRTAIVRIGIVLGAGGGALETMMYPLGTKAISPFKLGLGGPINSGSQWMSWVHIDDVCGIIVHALENESVSGPLNATSPNPVTNKSFTKTLGAVLSRPTPFPIPGPALYLRFGESASILTKGQKVLPENTLKSGYTFKYDALNEALKQALGEMNA